MSPGRERARIAIVGGGITGLAAAHRLVELRAGSLPETSVVVLEAATAIGGQIRTERAGDYLIEGGPDTLLTQKPWGVALCERLGIAGELEDLSERGNGTAILHRGRLLKIPEGFLMMAPTRLAPILRSPLFSWWGKARMLAEPLVPSRRVEVEDESLASFVRRRFGREVLERVAEPVMAGLYTADASRMSLRMTMPRFLDLEANEGSITRPLRRAAASRARPFGHGTGRGSFVAPRLGLGSIVEALRARLPGCDIRTGCEVTGLLPSVEPGQWSVRLSGGETLTADAVVLAGPAYASAGIVRDLDPPLATDLAALPYATCATVTLSYPRDAVRGPLDTLGFFVPRTEGLPILACSFVSEKFAGRSPSGMTVLRVFLGGARAPEALDPDDAGLARSAHAVLSRVLSIDGAPALARVHRFPRSMPQFSVGDAAWVSRVAERVKAHPGLFLGGSATGAVGLPDCIRSGESAADRAAEYVKTVPAATRRDAWRSTQTSTQRSLAPVSPL